MPSRTQALHFLKQRKIKVDFSKWVLSDFDDFNEILKKNLGLFCWNDAVQGTVLVLRPFEDKWEYLEVLMHEIHHVVQHFAKRKKMFEEIEAQAYLFEHLFRSIRRKLQGTDKV